MEVLSCQVQNIKQQQLSNTNGLVWKIKKILLQRARVEAVEWAHLVHLLLVLRISHQTSTHLSNLAIHIGHNLEDECETKERERMWLLFMKSQQVSNSWVWFMESIQKQQCPQSRNSINFSKPSTPQIMKWYKRVRIDDLFTIAKNSSKKYIPQKVSHWKDGMYNILSL